MRLLIAALLALALCACGASTPARLDPNLQAQLLSAETQVHDIAAADAARVTAAAECAKAESDVRAAVCALGVAAVNGSGGRQVQPVVPQYTPPPTMLQQFGEAAQRLFPFFQAGLNYSAQNHLADVNARTSRDIASFNAARETATVQALAHWGETAAASDAARAPTIQIGANGVYSAGPVTQVGGDIQNGDRTNTTVGGDQTGRDHIVDSHDTTVCTAGAGGPGGGSGDPNAAGASGAGGAGAAGGACGQQGH